jgi:hypothetical protein
MKRIVIFAVGLGAGWALVGCSAGGQTDAGPPVTRTMVHRNADGTDLVKYETLTRAEFDSEVVKRQEEQEQYREALASGLGVAAEATVSPDGSCGITSLWVFDVVKASAVNVDGGNLVTNGGQPEQWHSIPRWQVDQCICFSSDASGGYIFLSGYAHAEEVVTPFTTQTWSGVPKSAWPGNVAGSIGSASNFEDKFNANAAFFNLTSDAMPATQICLNLGTSC